VLAQKSLLCSINLKQIPECKFMLLYASVDNGFVLLIQCVFVIFVTMLVSAWLHVYFSWRVMELCRFSKFMRICSTAKFCVHFWRNISTFRCLSTSRTHRLSASRLTWVSVSGISWQKWCTSCAIKDVALYFYHIFTDFKNVFTGILCGQFAVMWLLYIPPNHKCVSILPCET